MTALNTKPMKLVRALVPSARLLFAGWLAIVPLVFVSSPLSAAKLRGVRKATRNNSSEEKKEEQKKSPKNNKRQRRKQQDSSSRRQNSANRSTQRSGNASRRREPVKSRRLASISNTVHPDAVQLKQQKRNGRRANGRRQNQHRHRQHHRPARAYRSPMHLGASFHSIGAHQPLFETVVTEEVIYAEPAMYSPPSVVCFAEECQQPVVMTESYPPPVYTAEAPPAIYETPAPVVHPTAAPMPVLPPWYVRFGAEYGSGSTNVDRLGFDLLATRTAGFGIDTTVRLFRERDGAYRDHMWMGDFNVTYELFPTENVRTRAGIGFNWLSDDYGGETGLNLTLGTEVRLTDWLMLGGETDFGTLGDADLFHARATLGVTYGAVEWFAGYDHVDIGGIELRGVLAGIRFRF